MANVAWLVNAVAGAPEYSGRMVRQAMSVALGGATAARPLGARSGVRPGTPASTVALPTATSYVIHPHAGVLDLQTSAIAGPYMYVVGSDGADETGTVNAAHGTWPRKDILWVRIDDPSEAGTDPPLIVTGYTVGVAATPGTQVPPATPARAMRLATISVPLSGGGSPTITFDAPILDTMIAVMPAPTTTTTAGTSTSGATETRDAVLGVYTFTAEAGRRYRAVMDGLHAAGSVSDDVFVANIRNGGASTPTAASPCVATAYFVSPALGAGARTPIPIAGTFVPGAGVVTLSVFMVRMSGTGTASAYSNPSKGRELYAVDLGPA